MQDVKVWFKAARDGDSKSMAKLLAQRPRLISAVDAKGKTALHHAANHGHDNVVTMLLGERPTLISANDFNHWTAFHCAVSKGRVNTVTQLLAMAPHVARRAICDGRTPLHLAAFACHNKVVELLLAANPKQITQLDASKRTALHWTAMNSHSKGRGKGRGKVFAQLHAACPRLIDARDIAGKTALHYAAENDHSDLATQIFAVRPELVAEVDSAGCNALHSAVRGESRWVPGKTKRGAARVIQEELFPSSDKEFVTKLWRMDPQTLHVANKESLTPFELAVIYHDNELIELFQGSVSIDGIVSAFAKDTRGRGEAYQYKPVIEAQCESLWDSLNQDVAPIVFGYIGLNPSQRKRAQPDIKGTSRKKRRKL